MRKRLKKKLVRRFFARLTASAEFKDAVQAAMLQTMKQPSHVQEMVDCGFIRLIDAEGESE